MYSMTNFKNWFGSAVCKYQYVSLRSPLPLLHSNVTALSKMDVPQAMNIEFQLEDSFPIQSTRPTAEFKRYFDCVKSLRF